MKTIDRYPVCVMLMLDFKCCESGAITVTWILQMVFLEKIRNSAAHDPPPPFFFFFFFFFVFILITYRRRPLFFFFFSFFFSSFFAWVAGWGIIRNATRTVLQTDLSQQVNVFN